MSPRREGEIEGTLEVGLEPTPPPPPPPRFLNPPGHKTERGTLSIRPLELYTYTGNLACIEDSKCGKS